MIPKPIQLAQDLIRATVCAGDRVVDATLGNGHDALFLAQLVGSEGLVIGFDVQQAAVDNSLTRMKAHDISWVDFYCCGHEDLTKKVESGVSVVMFNLGYLPKADKSLITQKDTTLEALRGASQTLKPGGLITVMCYPGHKGGEIEASAVKGWAGALSREAWRVFHYEMLNGENAPPFLVVVEKVKEG